MRINHNISSLITQASLFKTNRTIGKNLEKLSTGFRINRSADDAAGLGVSENLRAQVKGIHQALQNTQDAISMLNIAEGALAEMSDILQRMRELVIQAKNDSYTQSERNYMGDEFTALGNELDRIADTTNFNGMTIFAGMTTSDRANGDPKSAEEATSAWSNGSDSVFGANDDGSANHFNIMVGQNFTATDSTAFNANGSTSLNSFEKTAENFITIQIGQMDTQGLFNKQISGGQRNGWDVLNDPTIFNDNIFDASSAWQQTAYGSLQGKLTVILELIDGKDLSRALTAAVSSFNTWSVGTNYTGLERVNRMRSYIGATINRLEHNMNNLIEQEASQQAAESQIRDVDFAQETASYSKNQILTRSATSMLAQANVKPQSVLQLLR